MKPWDLQRIGLHYRRPLQFSSEVRWNQRAQKKVDTCMIGIQTLSDTDPVDGYYACFEYCYFEVHDYKVIGTFVSSTYNEPSLFLLCDR